MVTDSCKQCKCGLLFHCLHECVTVMRAMFNETFVDKFSSCGVLNMSIACSFRSLKFIHKKSLSSVFDHLPLATQHLHVNCKRVVWER